MCIYSVYFHLIILTANEKTFCYHQNVLTVIDFFLKLINNIIYSRLKRQKPFISSVVINYVRL